MTDLVLDLPWLQSTPDLGQLRIRRGEANVLAYEDGIQLTVRILDPSDYSTIEELLASEHAQRLAGTVTLVAGLVPVSWRPHLRAAGVSFVDVAGVAAISWPRIEVNTGQFARQIQRRRSPLPMQKGHAVVIQELVITSLQLEAVTVTELATRSGVGVPTASRAVTQLASHGLVTKRKTGTRVIIDVPDPASVARLLAERTRWPQGPTVSGYLWGPSSWAVAASASRRAIDAAIPLAITGRAALAYVGILATSSPPQVHCWVGGDYEHLDEIARAIGLEPAPADESNVILSADPWNLGLHRRESRSFESLTASVAHRLRVWCDVQDEPRGVEFATLLWKELQRNGESNNGE